MRAENTGSIIGPSTVIDQYSNGGTAKTVDS